MPSVADIHAALFPHLPAVVLDPGLFGASSALSGLLEQYFASARGAIHVSGVDGAHYTYDSQAGVILFSGTATDGPLAGMALASVRIFTDQNGLQLQIEAHPGGSWLLSQAFPDLTSPIIGQLPFRDVGVYFSSIDGDNDTLGFFFQGSLDFDDPALSLLKFLLPGVKAPQVWGAIEMVGSTTVDGSAAQYLPKTVLVFDDTADEVTLKPFTLTGPLFKLFTTPFFNTYDRQWQNDSFVRVVSHLQFKSQVFQLQADIHDLTGEFDFEIDTDVSIVGALDELGTLLGLPSLGIPGFTLANPGAISLQNIRVAFDPQADQKIKLIAVEIGTDANEKLTLWDGVYLEKVDVVFHLTPDGTGGYVVGGEISGCVENWLQLQAGFATDHHYSFHGALYNCDSPGSPPPPITIADVYRTFTGSPHADLPDIEISTLDFSLDRPADGSGPSYNGEIEIDLKWRILDEPVLLELDGIRFTLSHTASPLDTKVTAGGVITIGDYSVGTTAEYDSTDGWTFDGKASAAGDPPTLATLLDAIQKTLPVDASKPIDLPPFLAGWDVQAIAAHFTKQKKNFDFTATIGNRDVPSLAIDFGIHLAHGADAFTKTFDADVSVATGGFAVAAHGEIVQTTVSSPPSKTLSFTGSYAAATPPKLSDFITWIAGAAGATANLPAELAIDAELQDLGIRVEQKDQDPQIVELAAEFGLQVDGSDWDLYVAYTNSASFTPDGKRALVNGQPVYVFGAAIGGLLDVSKLPLVGKIPGIDTFRIDKLGFFYTNAQFADASAQLHFDVPAISPPRSVAPDATAAVLTQPGFTLLAVFGNEENASKTGVNAAGSMPLPVATGQPAQQHPPGFSGTAAAPKDPIHWLDLNKTIGPVSLQKIGLGYEKSARAGAFGTVAFYVDGAFTIAGFAMALDRLGISVDVPNPTGGVAFNPIADIAFHLGGLFVSYKSPAFQISGGFITLPGGGINFIGEFSVVAGSYGLQAYGGFSNQDAHPSLFLFLHLEAPLGGPPFLFVDGLAGGFGVNRAFKLPTFAELTNYPFLPSSSTIPVPSQLTGDPSSQLATMTTALTSLAQYVPVQDGEYWIAAGIDVSSFEMIDVSAVLSVAFGVNFQVGVVGTAAMTLPVKEPEPIAYIQIDFEVVFTPSDGLLAAFGKITPASFIYGGMVHLSGGFAFQTWFSGPNEGNYVVTVGGYNLHYQRPSIYPDVPRLQATFGIDSLNVTGDGYFALVPHALMAGLDIHATWSLGPLNAWFDAGVDFLLNWKPFHYEADARIQIGISLTIKVLFVKIRITVHAGVDLEIWGPPFAGRATVDLDIVSFTIAFGRQPVTEQVDWKGFSAFLPSVAGDATHRAPAAAGFASAAADEDANKPLVNIAVAQGLTKAFKPGESPEGLDWLIDANAFVLQTESTAPCTDAVFNDGAPLKTRASSGYLDPDNLAAGVASALDSKETPPFYAYKPAPGVSAWNTLSFGITPMGLQNIRSTHTVTLQHLDDQGQLIGYAEDVIVELNTRNMSRALWGNGGAVAPTLQSGQELVAGALAGFSLVPMIWFPRRTTFISYYDLVFDVNDLSLEQDTLPVFNTTAFADPETTYAALDDGTLFASTADARAGVVTLLRQNGFPALVLSKDGAINTGQYTADPMLAYSSSTSETHL